MPIPAVLRDYLTEHRVNVESRDGFVFGRSTTRPFNPSSVNQRAATARRKANLASLTLQEARHTFASLMIAAGVNVKALSTYMGHSSVTITLDRYGHLMPGNEVEAAEMLDSYVARSDTAARLAQL